MQKHHDIANTLVNVTSVNTCVVQRTRIRHDEPAQIMELVNAAAEEVKLVLIAAHVDHVKVQKHIGLVDGCALDDAKLVSGAFFSIGRTFRLSCQPTMI